MDFFLTTIASTFPCFQINWRFGLKSTFDALRTSSVVEFLKQVDFVNFRALSSKIICIQSVGLAFSLVWRSKSRFGGNRHLTSFKFGDGKM